MGQLNTITTFITQLLTQHVGQFAYLGQTMFLSLATIMIVWFGVKSALSSGRGFQFGNFAGLIMMNPANSAQWTDLLAAVPLVGLPILDTAMVVFSRQRRSVCLDERHDS